ncbi:asparagine synthase (glutamine-hydrolyzing) [Pinibacter aurantiacus]|uniref:asparagine synthase (glutamine-hydrolyzing) n=1 Tax=Pinibacter aurantiacus TaxID=2851599 RepID=A0A9E2S976_9BACT|nr:asparagine synthase (glutamine-hydrolyzing) [Pinibacter aurantiacus]MBV4357897.1 asparagine synthase (glutamine-hydrolyzing) [Pinibacter aurantiacus]
MCGIAGIVTTNTSFIAEQHLLQMTNALQHRGPEKERLWINEDKTVGFGHRRLCIIDLSEAGAQPMHYLNRYTIVYNGEIYNYIEIKETLQKQGYSFVSHSDTEVILAAYDCWKEKCLQQFDGMFAFAIWDNVEKKLFAARDRFGEKPFFYHFDQSNNFLFASEMKALWAVGIEKEMSNSMLLNYISLGWVQNPVDNMETFYSGIFQLPHASYLIFSLYENDLSIVRYWDIDKEKKIDISAENAIEQLAQLFTTSIKRRLRSDVSVGTSLSGGLDSSSVVATIKKISEGADLSCFSAIFPNFEKDESKYIADVREKFNLKSFTTTPTAEGFINDFEKLCYHQEEPFGSSSIYAQFKVFELAKQNDVTVLLDGQGADETLAGYSKYIHWFLQELLTSKFHVFQQQKKMLVQNNVSFDWGLKNYVAALLPAQAASQLQKKSISSLLNNRDIKRDFVEAFLDRETMYKPIVTKLNDMLYFNTMQFGLQELLRYADRNSMAHSREVRLPFLSHELVEFIFSLPAELKINNGFTKNILRQTMQDSLPSSIVWRKDKVGFEPPQKKWMEQKQVQDYIMHAKEKLVAKKILNENVLNKPVKAKGSTEGGNNDFYYLVASKML